MGKEEFKNEEAVKKAVEEAKRQAEAATEEEKEAAAEDGHVCDGAEPAAERLGFADFSIFHNQEVWCTCI